MRSGSNTRSGRRAFRKRLDEPGSHVPRTRHHRDHGVGAERRGEEARVRQTYGLIVLALRTDMTRVVTYMSGSESNGLAIPEIGIPQTRHELSHHNGDPEQMRRLSRSESSGVRRQRRGGIEHAGRAEADLRIGRRVELGRHLHLTA